MRLLGGVVFAVLVGAAVGCSCLLEDDKARFERHDYVYTVLVTKRITPQITKAMLEDSALPDFDLENIMWEVIIKGVLKQPPELDHEFIESRTILVSPPEINSCFVTLNPGNYYVIGGNLNFNSEKHFALCDTIFQLRDTALPPCPEGCAKWTDGCDSYYCSKDGDIVSVEDRDCLVQGPALCESTKFKDDSPECPLDCKIWNDGCNECSCVDGVPQECTERFCFVQGTPFCAINNDDEILEVPDQIVCPQVIPSCAERCMGQCVFVPGTATSCPTAKCLKPRKTYHCDIFSYWNSFEQNMCLKRGRSYSVHTCLREYCCTDRDLPFGGGRKRRYCNATPECGCE